MSNLWRAIEGWGGAHPVVLAIISLLVGALPAGFSSYNFGFYEGTSASESHWRKTFDNKLKEGVDQQISVKCGEVTQELNISCQKKTKVLEDAISEKSQENAELTDALVRSNKRADVIDTESVLTESASSILEQLTSARNKHDRDSEAALRQRFFSLLSAIRTANEIYTAWSALFDSKATELFERYNNKENISTDEIIGYLQGFTSDLDAKRKVIQDEVNEANKIKNSKY